LSRRSNSGGSTPIDDRSRGGHRRPPPRIDSFITSRRLPVTVILPLAGHHDAFDGEQLAADHRSQARPVTIADLRLALDLAESDTSARRGTSSRVFLCGPSPTSSWRSSAPSLPCGASVDSSRFKVAHGPLSRVVAADDQQQRVVVDRPFLAVEAVLGERVRDQMLCARSRPSRFSV